MTQGKNNFLGNRMGWIVVVLALAACSQNSAPTTQDLQPPQVVAAFPQAAAMLHTPIDIVFNEPLGSNIDGFVVQVALAGQPIGGSVSLVNPVTVRFQPFAALALNNTYEVFVDRVFDRSGNFMAQPYRWEFATVPYNTPNAPAVLGTDPKMGVMDAAIDKPILVYFDKPMDPSSFVGRFSLETTGAEVSGQVDYDASLNALVFVPDAFLGERMLYKGTVRAGVKDASGNPTLGDYWFHFTTKGFEEPEPLCFNAQEEPVECE